MNMVRFQGSSGGRGRSTRCQDCGNQAKKDCIYMRCRICCKSKGFECQTHVKSTWVPAYRRRHRYGSDHQLHHLGLLPINPTHHHHHHHHQHNPKRLRQDTPSSSIGLQMENFPSEVNSTATFRCFRVSSMDGAETVDDQCAYQTSVSIGGHLFKGILYDQGPEQCHNFGESSSNQPHDDDPNFAIFSAAAATGALASTSGGAQESTLAPSTYPFPLNAFMSGTQLFLHPKS